jgi:hypothetical protein
VAKWFTQIAGLDLGEIFSPFVKINSIHILLALDAHFILKFIDLMPK